MYPDGSVLDIHFSEERLNDMAGDPYWIDLTVEEATALFEALRARFDANALVPKERPIIILT
jgi:hypothetical protein